MERDVGNSIEHAHIDPIAGKVGSKRPRWTNDLGNASNEKIEERCSR